MARAVSLFKGTIRGQPLGCLPPGNPPVGSPYPRHWPSFAIPSFHPFCRSTHEQRDPRSRKTVPPTCPIFGGTAGEF